LDFLSLETARQSEDEFLENMSMFLPQNTLLITVAQKKYELSEFKDIRAYPEKIGSRGLQHGWEFPRYFLAEREDIKVMDFYEEYDLKEIKKWDNVFYYKSLYAHHEAFVPDLIEVFEEQHVLDAIGIKHVENRDFTTWTPRDLYRGENSLSVVTNKDQLLIGLFRVDVEKLNDNYQNYLNSEI
jgi:hypothetical protein